MIYVPHITGPMGKGMFDNEFFFITAMSPSENEQAIS